MIRRIVSFALLFAIAGCGGGGSTGGSGVVVQRPSVIAVNAVPDSTSVDIKLNETLIGSGLAYLGSSPDYRRFDPGDYDLSGGVAGTGVDLSTNAQTLVDGQSVAAVALGKIDFGDEYNKRFQVLPVSFDRTVPNGSKARLIFVNGLIRETGVQTPPVDFQDGDRPQYPLTDVAYATSSTELVDIGTYTFQARRADSELVFAEKSITFETGKIYLAVLTGQEGQSGATGPQIFVLPLTTY